MTQEESDKAVEKEAKTGSAPAEKPEAGPVQPDGEKKAETKAESKADAKAAAPGDETRAKRRTRGRSMRRRSRLHLENLKKVVRDKQYPIDEGIKLLKEVATSAKFNQTVNIVMHLGIEPKHADQMVRGAISLPKGIGKTKRVIAFCEGEDADKAKAAGAAEVGIEELVKKISDGWMEFDVAVAHPRSMSKVGKLGRVLGPQGKMPSPKNGTVTPDVESAVRDFVAGKIEFRNDAGANIHAVVGKVNFSEADLKENILAFIDHIKRMKPAASKGTYIKKVCVSGTMSPAIELEIGQH